MNRCEDIEIGSLLPSYEANTLGPSEVLHFEEHLLVCDYCRHELERAVEVGDLLLRHKTGLKEHYAKSGEDFAFELAGLARARKRQMSFGTLAAAAKSAAGWFAEKVNFAVVLPSAVVATLALFILLKQQPSLDESLSRGDLRQGSEASGRLESKPDDETGADEASPQTGTVSSDGATPDDLGSTRPADPSARETASIQETRRRRLETLLPGEPIPYADLSTRGSDLLTASGAEEFQQCMALYAAKGFDSCAVRLREFTKSHPLDDRAHMYLGSARYMNGDYEGAVESLTTAGQIAGAGTSPRVPLYRAAALIKLGRYAEARSVLAELVRSPNRIVAEQAGALMRELE